jgi:hypothetical protein
MCGEMFIFGEVLYLTNEEVATIGHDTQREVPYCRDCLKSMRNLHQGANILAGVFERKLRAAGVIGADAVADKFKERLVAAATRKLQ